MRYLIITKMLLLGLRHGHEGSNKHELSHDRLLLKEANKLPGPYALGDLEDYRVGKMAALENTPILSQRSQEVVWDPYNPDWFYQQFPKQEHRKIGAWI